MLFMPLRPALLPRMRLTALPGARGLTHLTVRPGARALERVPMAVPPYLVSTPRLSPTTPFTTGADEDDDVPPYFVSTPSRLSPTARFTTGAGEDEERLTADYEAACKVLSVACKALLDAEATSTACKALEDEADDASSTSRLMARHERRLRLKQLVLTARKELREVESRLDLFKSTTSRRLRLSGVRHQARKGLGRFDSTVKRVERWEKKHGETFTWRDVVLMLILYEHGDILEMGKEAWRDVVLMLG